MKYPFSLIIALVFLAACKETYVDQSTIEASTKTNIPTVRVENISLTKEPIPIVASGTVGAKSEIKLSFKTGGVIQRLYVKETQTVRRGQLLASLRNTEINAQVKKAQQGVDKATRDVSRIKKMYLDSVATLEQVENLETVLDLAKSDLEIAQFNQVYSEITAPVSGKIRKKFAENNELIGPGVPVFLLVSNDGKGYNLNIGVADKDIIRTQLGDKATILFDAYPNTEFSAAVSEIADAADPRTGVFSVELTVNPQTGKALKNGFIGKVTLYPSNQPAYYKIPMNALIEGYKDKANIYTINGDKAQRISIQPTYIGNDFFTIRETGLTGVDRVITDGAAYLKDGVEIKVVE